MSKGLSTVLWSFILQNYKNPLSTDKSHGGRDERLPAASAVFFGAPSPDGISTTAGAGTPGRQQQCHEIHTTNPAATANTTAARPTAAVLSSVEQLPEQPDECLRRAAAA